MINSAFNFLTQASVFEHKKASDNKIIDQSSPSNRTLSSRSSEGSSHDLMEIYDPLSPTSGINSQPFAESSSMEHIEGSNPLFPSLEQHMLEPTSSIASPSIKPSDDDDVSSRLSVTARAMSSKHINNPLAGRTNTSKYAIAADSNANGTALASYTEKLFSSQPSSTKFNPPMIDNISSSTASPDRERSYSTPSPLTRTTSYMRMANNILGPPVTDIGEVRTPSSVEAKIKELNEKVTLSRTNSISSIASSTSSKQRSPRQQQQVQTPPSQLLRSKSLSIDPSIGPSIAPARVKSYRLVSNPMVALAGKLTGPNKTNYISVTPVAAGMKFVADASFDLTSSADISSTVDKDRVTGTNKTQMDDLRINLESTCISSPDPLSSSSPDVSPTSITESTSQSLSVSPATAIRVADIDKPTVAEKPIEAELRSLSRTLSVREKAAFFNNMSTSSPDKIVSSKPSKIMIPKNIISSDQTAPVSRTMSPTFISIPAPVQYSVSLKAVDIEPSSTFIPIPASTQHNIETEAVDEEPTSHIPTSTHVQHDIEAEAVVIEPLSLSSAPVQHDIEAEVVVFESLSLSSIPAPAQHDMEAEAIDINPISPVSASPESIPAYIQLDMKAEVINIEPSSHIIISVPASIQRDIEAETVNTIEPTLLTPVQNDMLPDAVYTIEPIESTIMPMLSSSPTNTNAASDKPVELPTESDLFDEAPSSPTTSADNEPIELPIQLDLLDMTPVASSLVASSTATDYNDPIVQSTKPVILDTAPVASPPVATSAASTLKQIYTISSTTPKKAINIPAPTMPIPRKHVSSRSTSTPPIASDKPMNPKTNAVHQPSASTASSHVHVTSSSTASHLPTSPSSVPRLTVSLIASTKSTDSTTISSTNHLINRSTSRASAESQLHRIMEQRRKNGDAGVHLIHHQVDMKSYRWSSRWKILILMIVYMAMILAAIASNHRIQSSPPLPTSIISSIHKQPIQPMPVSRSTSTTTSSKHIMFSSVSRELVMVNVRSSFVQVKRFIHPVNIVKLLRSKLQEISCHIQSIRSIIDEDGY